MVLEDFKDYEYASDFRLKMIATNHFSHALNQSFDIINNLPVFKYNITSLQSLANYYADNTLDYNSYINIISSLLSLLEDLEKYLFDLNSIILKMDYIYIDPEDLSPKFTICPACNNDFYSDLNILFEDLLKSIDHSDEALVLIAYKLCSESSKDEFNVSTIKNILYSKITTTASSVNTKSGQSNLNTYQSNISIDRKNPYSDSCNIDQEYCNYTTNLNDNSYGYNNSGSLLSNSERKKKLINKFPTLDTNNKISTFQNTTSNDFKNKFNFSKLKTIDKIKTAISCVIFLLLISLSIYLYITKGFKNSICLLLTFIDICYLAGLIKFINDIFIFSDNNTLVESSDFHANNIEILYNNTEINNNPTGNLTVFQSETITNEATQNVFGKTEVLGERISNTHKLIYTGSDNMPNSSISSFPFKIGKLDNLQMVIDNNYISRIHACIYSENDCFYLEDMNSTNGTYVNGDQIPPLTKTQIFQGDSLTFSQLTYVFE